jgi:predicted MFS family arabinose efflux permease
MRSSGALPVRKVLDLLRRRHVAFAVVGVMLAFGGTFASFTYLRPFLQTYTHATLPQLSLLLLAFGLGGFAGTPGATALLGRHLHRMLRGLPLAIAAVTMALLAVGHGVWPVAVLLLAWGALNAAVPVAWFNWLAVEVADEPEAGGGLMVAAVQLAIMAGAGFGGLLLDHLSIAATFAGGAALLVAGSLVVGSGDRLRPRRRIALRETAPVF